MEVEDDLLEELERKERYIAKQQSIIEQERKEKEIAIRNKKLAEQKAEQERREKEEVKHLAEQERHEKIATKIKLAKLMKDYGKSIDKIIKETGLSKNKIEHL